MLGIRIQVFGDVDLVPKKERGIQSFKLIYSQVSVLGIRKPLACFSDPAGKGNVVKKHNCPEKDRTADPDHYGHRFIIDRKRTGGRCFYLRSICCRNLVILRERFCMRIFSFHRICGRHTEICGFVVVNGCCSFIFNNVTLLFDSYRDRNETCHQHENRKDEPGKILHFAGHFSFHQFS